MDQPPDLKPHRSRIKWHLLLRLFCVLLFLILPYAIFRFLFV